jgi:hypothetical protein
LKNFTVANKVFGTRGYVAGAGVWGKKHGDVTGAVVVESACAARLALGLPRAFLATQDSSVISFHVLCGQSTHASLLAAGCRSADLRIGNIFLLYLIWDSTGKVVRIS